MGRPITCEGVVHYWRHQNQGNKLIANGHLPGDSCQCGKMIIITRYCCRCGETETLVVKKDSKEYKEWDLEEPEEYED